MTSRELELQRNHPVRIEAAGGVVRVRCVAGTVWLTSATRAGDVVLRAGESRALRAQGLTLIEAIGSAGTARVVLQPPLLGWMHAFSVAMKRFLLSWPHEYVRAVRFSRRRNPLAG